MKLIYLINQYPSPSHTFIRREIRALEGLGFEITRVSLRPQHETMVDAIDELERGNTHVILGQGAAGRLGTALVREAVASPIRFAQAVALTLKLARRSERGLLTHLAYLAEACVLKSLATKLGASHVHAHFGTNPAAVALLCQVLGGPTYSLTIHGPEEFDSPRALSLDLKVHGAAFVNAISEFTRSQLFRWVNSTEWSKIHVIRCGLDALYLGNTVPPLPESSSRRFVCVGRLAEQKGHLVLIDAVAQLVAEGRDLEVALVGDGPLRNEIESRIDRLGLKDKVFLLGWRDDAGVRDEILRSRAMVLPSFAEGLPVVLMESLALKRPAISTYVAGIPELIEPGLNGWLVPPGSANALALAMADCLDSPSDLLARMGGSGAVNVTEKHNARTEATKIAALLKPFNRSGRFTPVSVSKAAKCLKNPTTLLADHRADTV